MNLRDWVIPAQILIFPTLAMLYAPATILVVRNIFHRLARAAGRNGDRRVMAGEASARRKSRLDASLGSIVLE